MPFTKYTMPNYLEAKHNRLICEKLEKVESGEIRRLMIFTPPRHGKSELSSKRFPAWYLGRNPYNQVISASYNSDLSRDFGREVRNIIYSDEYKVLFPGITVAADSSAVNRFHTNKGGSFVAAGVGTAITGRGADIFNIDDPVKDKIEAESETTRTSVWDWYRSVVYTRLMPNAAIVLTMTRWHEEDLAGKLLEEAKVNGDKWEILKLPAFATDFDDPLGRNVNEALWPERYDTEALNGIRAVIGERDFGALYQQDPRPAGTSFFDVQNGLINGAPVEYPLRCDCVYAVMDTAVKTGSKNDGTGTIYFALSQHVGNKVTILDWDITQIEGGLLENYLPGVFQNCELLAQKCGARGGSLGLFIEDKNSGSILIQQGQRRGWPTRAIESKLTSVGKDERAVSVSGYVTRGDVKISKHAYDKITVYKGRTGNHFLMQTFRFQIGVKDQVDDLLDCWCYGIAIGLGDNQGF